MVTFKDSVKGKILIPFMVISFVFFVVTQILVSLYLVSTLSEKTDLQLMGNTRILHQVLEASYQESIENYLKGITEQNVLMLKKLQEERKAGEMTPEEWMDRARSLILSQRIGHDGYTYVLDRSGFILIHPDQSLIGVESIFGEEIRTRATFPDEYVEYSFQGRMKVLYRSYISELDWIVSITAYRDDFRDLLDFKGLEFPSRTKGDLSFLIDRRGNLIAASDLEGGRLPLDLVREVQLSAASSTAGMVEQEWDGEEYRVYYQALEEFSWIIGTAYPLKEIYGPVKKLSFILAFLNGLTILIIVILLTLMLRNITGPLNRLTMRMLEEDEFDLVDLRHHGDEISILENVFELFLQRLQFEELKVSEANEENRQLARFPSELQFPLIRMDHAGYIHFMNSAAREIKEQITELGQDRIRRSLFQSLLERDTSVTHLDFELLGISYKIFLTPLQGTDELYLHFHDQTTEMQLETMKNIWQSVFETSPEGIIVTDTLGYIEQINPGFSSITGYSEEEIYGTAVTNFQSYRHDNAFYQNLLLQLKEKGRWLGEIWIRMSTGDLCQLWLSVSSFLDKGETKYMGIFHDITDLRKKEEELDHVIHYDSLTDLPNRNSFFEEMNALMIVSQERESMALMILDVDNFTLLFNTLGIEAGDRYLRELSQLFQDVTRAEDMLARLSTSEFALLMKQGADRQSCQQLIQRILSKLDRSITLNEHHITPLVNMGISLFPEDGDSPDLLIRRARTAMHRARLTRRGSYLFFESSMEQNQLDQFDVDIALKGALRNREFHLVYQPKGFFQEQKLDGFEALLRWNRPGKGEVSPTHFIPVLEENGLIIEVGYWIIGEVCRFINEIRTYSLESFRVAINISARQLAAPDFLDRLIAICKDHHVPASYIDLEITENMAALDLEEILDLMQKFRKTGFSISIDDFGTGYSSLAYLQDIPFDSIKIDRSFIAAIEQKENSLAIVRSIVALAKSMKKQTIAEGVETAEQSRICADEGCDLIQGFLLSPPLAREKALEFYIQFKDEQEIS